MADEESDGQPTAAADGDDLNSVGGVDDEDGVGFTSSLVPGRSATVQVTVSRPGRLFAWIDFNRNGSWADAGEQVFAGISLATGPNSLSFPVPDTAAEGTTYSRWRFTVQGSTLSFTGLAPDGEVEDHPVRIIPDRARCDLGREGREFWLTFPGNYAPDPTHPPQPALCIQGPPGTAGTVSMAALGFLAHFTIPASAAAWVRLPALADLGNSNDTVLPGRAVRVRASADVRVTAFNPVRHTTDSYQALQVSTLGTEYLVLAGANLHTGVPLLNGSQFAIVGTESNTVVTLTPSATTAVRTPGVPYTILLQPGDVYQLRDTNDAPADLTGTLIRATKPVAVFAGHACANVPGSTQWYCDTLVEQLLPIHLWGNDHYLGPLATRSGGSLLRVLAAYDGTAVETNGVPATTLSARGVYQALATGPTRIATSRPVLVAHYATSSDFDGNPNADPFMALVQATRHFSQAYIVCTPTNNFPSNYVQLIVPLNVTHSVLLVGLALSPTLFQPFPSGNYAVTNVPVAPGHHIVSAGAPFGILTHGWALYDSYGHPGCFLLGDVLPPRLTPPVTHVTLDVTQNPQTPGLAAVPDFRAATEVEDNCTTKFPRPQQRPEPGTLLPPGRYTVDLILLDDNGNPGQTNVTLTVMDPSPVTIQCPQDLVVHCSTNNGAFVAFEVRAFTRYETNVAVTSIPPSGSFFRLNYRNQRGHQPRRSKRHLHVQGYGDMRPQAPPPTQYRGPDSELVRRR